MRASMMGRAPGRGRPGAGPYVLSRLVSRRFALAAVDDFVVFLLGAVPRVAVLLLKHADELLGLTLGAIEVVISQLAPLLLHLPLHLVPLALEHVSIHGWPPRNGSRFLEVSPPSERRSRFRELSRCMTHARLFRRLIPQKFLLTTNRGGDQ